jgi:riboflavin synthase
MFTGLVECIGEIRSLKQQRGILELTLSVPVDLSDSSVGDSFCIQGACLTAVGFTSGGLRVEVSQETLERTTLGSFAPGRPVNLERSLRFSDRLGGHLVTGHVDGIGCVVEKKQHGPNVDYRIQADPRLARYLIEKGSICVDGVSLTLGLCENDTFTVYLIPHTLNTTTLRFLQHGDRVNLEADIIGKYVERFLALQNGLRDRPEGVNRELLEKHGFVPSSKR